MGFALLGAAFVRARRPWRGQPVCGEEELEGRPAALVGPGGRVGAGQPRQVEKWRGPAVGAPQRALRKSQKPEGKRSCVSFW